jgi:hypothetical protein
MGGEVVLEFAVAKLVGDAGDPQQPKLVTPM